MKIDIKVTLTSDELMAALRVGSRPEDVLKELLVARLRFGLPFAIFDMNDVVVVIIDD